ncbi:hypothetical protein K443DRAFT_11989 [Laccaria amethystina LaAM-08-1]|uniref:Uncharacterized protein n=1 Tax=Laccaria amethystina LaAM-08-1 TaxID=1095629 RepID=A0A0C9XA92_9AGAR|nr:hypothetical protein K443DRAFT_11989 [Laccaria amethystina LaAM-08-1]
MAAGLGPLPPRRADPTRVAAKRAQPSGNPCTSYTSDYIKVYCLPWLHKEDHDDRGRIRLHEQTRKRDQDFVLSLRFVIANQVLLRHTRTLDSSGLASILAQVRPRIWRQLRAVRPPKLSFALPHLDDFVGAPANSPPSNNMESTVWQFASNGITAQWVNVDDSDKPPTYLLYNPDGHGYVEIMADPGKFTEHYPHSYAVHFVVSP